MVPCLYRISRERNPIDEPNEYLFFISLSARLPSLFSSVPLLLIAPKSFPSESTLEEDLPLLLPGPRLTPELTLILHSLPHPVILRHDPPLVVLRLHSLELGVLRQPAVVLLLPSRLDRPIKDVIVLEALADEQVSEKFTEIRVVGLVVESEGTAVVEVDGEFVGEASAQDFGRGGHLCDSLALSSWLNK